MPRLLPVLGYPTLADACQALRDEGLRDQEIAPLVGRSAAQVRASLSSRDFAKGPRTIVLPMELFRGLSPAAAARATSVPKLVLELLEVIQRDEVVDALLGEPEQARDG